MPLVDIYELGNYSSLFRKPLGRVLGRGLFNIFALEKVNDLYDRYSHLSGADFTDAVLEDIGVRYKVCFISGAKQEWYTKGAELDRKLSSVLPQGAFITISNHPCGHIDGLCLVDIFAGIRPDYKVMVNKILGRIRSLDRNFIRVIPTGSKQSLPTADSVNGVRAAFRHLKKGGALGLFPSGAVSDLSLKDHCVRDREWQDAIVRFIARSDLPVLPVRFLDGNSPFYYSLGLIDWRIRILRLPAEVFNKSGRPFRICVGPLIMPEQYEIFSTDVHQLGEFLRSTVYNLST